MKETSFIRQNIDKWNKYEGELRKKKKNPTLVSKLFVQITDDLSYAQTFYKNRSVRVYLNGIAQLLFNDINKSTRFKLKAFTDFWTIDLPVIMYKVRYELLFSFIFFMICVGIGVITSIHEPDFARSILGDRYVNMTVENIEKGDPMAVYKEWNELNMFLGITINNIKVAFVTFILGIFFGFGTLFNLLQNGIMLGTFQYFFIERNLFKESFLTIWQHGTLEISAIVIAGAAGFTIGRGLILPGTYTRFQSLRLTARRGLKIMLGLLPVFIFAAFIEGFFTRHTEAPDIIRLGTIIFSITFILLYFVIYPRRIAKKYPEKIEVDEKLSYAKNSLPDLKKILNNERLFGGTLTILKNTLSKQLKLVLILAVSSGIILSLLTSVFMPGMENSLLGERRILAFLVDYETNQNLFLFNTLIIASMLLLSMQIFNVIHKTQFTEPVKKFQMFLDPVNSLVTAMIINFLLYLPKGWAIVILIVTVPVLLLNLKVCFTHKIFFFAGFKRTFSLINSLFGDFLLLNLKFLIIGVLVLVLFRQGIYGSLLTFIKWNLWLEDVYVNLIVNLIVIFVFYTGFFLVFMLLSVANSLIYYSMLEKQSARYLSERIKNIGIKHTIRGYEIES